MPCQSVRENGTEQAVVYHPVSLAPKQHPEPIHEALYSFEEPPYDLARTLPSAKIKFAPRWITPLTEYTKTSFFEARLFVDIGLKGAPSFSKYIAEMCYLYFLLLICLLTMCRALFFQNEKAGIIHRIPLTSSNQVSFPADTHLNMLFLLPSDNVQHDLRH